MCRTLQHRLINRDSNLQDGKSQPLGHSPVLCLMLWSLGCHQEVTSLSMCAHTDEEIDYISDSEGRVPSA